MLTILNGYSVLAELNDVFLSQFLLLYRIKGYICTFSLMTDLTRCRYCWPRNSRWTQIWPNEHVVHSSRGGRGGRGGQRSFSVQRPATNQLPSPFGAPARPRQIGKDLSECDNTAISHSLRHTFLNSSTYSDNF